MSGLPRTALLLSSSDPNDPNVADSWTDVAKTRLIRVRNAGRGRQYELGQSVPGQFTADLLNIDEYLNPANSGSPLLNDAKLMRRIRWMMVEPAAGTGNLINSANLPGADPSFESYAVGVQTPFLAYFGAAPTVTATNPHSGTRASAQTITAGQGIQGSVVELHFIPGDTYTASVWVRQSAANKVDLVLNGHLNAPMASTTTSGAYVQLVGTFVADQPTLQVCVVCQAPTANATLTIDDIQVEQGSTASAFTTSGPRIRGVWGGHISALPTTADQDSRGYTGTAQLGGVGPLAALAQIGVQTDYVQMLLSKQPDYWWPLAGGSDATTFPDASGHNGPPLRRLDVNGGGTWTPGTSVAIPGEPGATGVTITGDSTNLTNTAPASVAQTGLRNTPQVSVGGASTPFGVTVAFWMSHTNANTTTIYPVSISDPAFTTYLDLNWAGNGTSGTLQAELEVDDGNNFVYTQVTDTWADGKPHLYVVTVNIGTSTGSLTLYVDGAQVGNGSATTTGWTGPYTMGVAQVGGLVNPLNGRNSAPMPSAVYNDMAIWNKALSAQDVTDLWTAAQGYSGEKTGARLSRYLGQYYVGGTSIDTGRTALGPSGATANTKLQQIAQRVVDSEAGLLFEDRDGKLTFQARDTRFLRTVPAAVFGDNTAAGEIPYRDAPLFGYDLVQVNNDAVVTQTGGTQATASDAASIRSYYDRQITVQTDTTNGLEAIDYANWLTANRSQPKQRIQRITVDPGANPAIRGAVLDLEIGQRYRVMRRARAANGGAGLTIQQDCFLENVAHRDYDPERGTWLVDLILSPAPLQPWILGDSTWGQLGITTVLGF